MLRLSFGVNGEFFVESTEALKSSDIDVMEELYRRIMVARDESIVVSEAMKGSMDTYLTCGGFMVKGNLLMIKIGVLLHGFRSFPGFLYSFQQLNYSIP